MKHPRFIIILTAVLTAYLFFFFDGKKVGYGLLITSAIASAPLMLSAIIYSASKSNISKPILIITLTAALTVSIFHFFDLGRGDYRGRVTIYAIIYVAYMLLALVLIALIALKSTILKSISIIILTFLLVASIYRYGYFKNAASYLRWRESSHVIALGFALTTFVFSWASKSERAAAARGFEIVATPATEMENIKMDMKNKFIPCGMGIGESADEMAAQNIAADKSRADLARSMSTYLQRLSWQYAQNVSSEAREKWEDGVRQLTDQEINGATVYKTITQYNQESNRYKIYSLIVLNPSIFKNAVATAAANQEEFELRAKKDDMMQKLDAGIAYYEAKYSATD